MTPFSKLSTTARSGWPLTQLQDIDGKAANVNDIGDGMSFQRAELGNGSRKCLG